MFITPIPAAWKEKGRWGMNFCAGTLMFINNPIQNSSRILVISGCIHRDLFRTAPAKGFNAAWPCFTGGHWKKSQRNTKTTWLNR